MLETLKLLSHKVLQKRINMDEKTPPIVVKQEPISDIEEYYEPVTPPNPATELAKPVKSEVVAVQSAAKPKSAKSSKKTKSSEKSHKKVKRLKGEPTSFAAKEEKLKKTSKMDQDSYIEPPRAGVYPDRTMSDFYCKVCHAHMNSVQVWESHIQGKRHLKNIQKAAASAAVTIKKEKSDDVDGLYYIDTRGARSPSVDSVPHERRPPSPSHENRRRRSSSEPASPPRAPVYATPANYGELNLTTFQRIDYMRELSESLLPQSENDVNEMKSIISLLSQSILQYEIRQLPFAVQQMLAKELFKGK